MSAYSVTLWRAAILIASVALAFEVGLYLGHRKGLEYARERQDALAYCQYVLDEAADAFAGCHDLAQRLKRLPGQSKRTPRLASTAEAPTCKNCGGAE